VRRLAVWALGAVAVAVVLVLVLVAALPLLVDVPRVQGAVASAASQVLGRQVKFRSLAVRILPFPAIELRGLEVAEDPAFGRDPFVTLDTGLMRLRLSPLLRGRVEFGEIVLRAPVISVIQNERGRWNVATLGGTEPKVAAPPARGRGRAGGAGEVATIGWSHVKIEKGVVTYLALGSKNRASRYRVEDLVLTLGQRGGPLAFEGTAKITPGDLAVKIADGLLGGNGARNLAEASLQANLTFEAKDVATVITTALGPSPTVGGALDGRLVLGGTLGAPSAAGEVELRHPTLSHTNPQCAPPQRRTVAFAPVKVNASWQDGRGIGRPLTTGIGAGTITTNVVAALDRGSTCSSREWPPSRSRSSRCWSITSATVTR
jgi:uncharacterized protein involved in outer membrane biogenesis